MPLHVTDAVIHIQMVIAFQVLITYVLLFYLHHRIPKIFAFICCSYFRHCLGELLYAKQYSELHIALLGSMYKLVVLTTEWLPGCRQTGETVVVRGLL